MQPGGAEARKTCVSTGYDRYSLFRLCGRDRCDATHLGAEEVLGFPDMLLCALCGVVMLARVYADVERKLELLSDDDEKEPEAP